MIRCGWVLTDLAGGGAERIPLLLAPALRETELEVLLLKHRIEHEIPADGPRVVTLSAGGQSLTRAWAPILARAIRNARTLDVLVAGLEWAPTFFAVACGTLAQKPVVATVHTDLARYREIEPLPTGWWWAMRRALHRCAAVVAVADDVADRVQSLGVDESRIHVIANPVKPFAGERKKCQDGMLRILTVASLKPMKGVDLILDAASRLVDLDFEWTVVGEGPERQSLVARAKELGLSERVHFLGFRPDPAPFYGAADIYVLPSRMEGFGLSLVEAMSAGLPVVATRCGRNVEHLLGDAAGDLVPNVDPYAIADAIRRLHNDPDRRAQLGQAGAEQARTFAPLLVAQRYDELLTAVVRRARGSVTSRTD